jgi:hypothetical protein
MAEHSITGIVAEGERKGERVWIYWSPEGGGWWQGGPFGWRERFSSVEDKRFKDALLCAKGEGWSKKTCGPWYKMADLSTIEIRTVMPQPYHPGRFIITKDGASLDSWSYPSAEAAAEALQLAE